MAYVVYEVESTAIIPECRFGRSFKTEAAAKAARTRMLRKLNNGTVLWKADDLAVAEFNFYHNKIKRQIERTNMMTGKTYMEDVNTPMCCSPSSETYWSM
jgi:hypothetical protein